MRLCGSALLGADVAEAHPARDQSLDLVGRDHSLRLEDICVRNIAAPRLPSAVVNVYGW